MNLSVIRNDLLDKIRLEIFTEKDIEIYIKDLVNFLDLGNYLRDIIFENDSEDKLATYKFDTKNMHIYFENIINQSLTSYPFNDINNIILFINLSIIQTIIHEVIHIYQNYLISEIDYPLIQLYIKEFIATGEMTDEEYEKFYYSLIFEREAIISSVENVLIIIKRFIDNDPLFEYFINQLTLFLKINYSFLDNKIYSPLELLFNEYFNENVPIISQIDLYDTIKLGFQVDLESFKVFDSEIKRNILNKNNLQ